MKKRLVSLLLALFLIGSQIANTALCVEQANDGPVTVAPTCIGLDERDD